MFVDPVGKAYFLYFCGFFSIRKLKSGMLSFVYSTIWRSGRKINTDIMSFFLNPGFYFCVLVYTWRLIFCYLCVLVSEHECTWAHVLLGVTVAVMKHHNQKLVGRKGLILLPCHCQRQAEAVQERCLLARSRWLLTLLSYSTQDHLPRFSTTHSGWAFPYKSSSKKMPCLHCSGQNSSKPIFSIDILSSQMTLVHVTWT